MHISMSLNDYLQINKIKQSIKIYSTYNQVEYIKLQSLTIKNQSNIIIGVHIVVNVN